MIHNITLSCLGVAVALFSAISPALIGNSIDLYLSGYDSYITMIGMACLLILTTPPLRLLANIYLQKISSKTRMNVKESVLKSLFTYNFSSKRKCGEIIDLVDGDVESALYLYHAVFLDIAINATLIILALSIIAYYYPVMIIAPLAGMLLSVTIYIFTKEKCDNLYMNYVNENTMTIGKICDLLMLEKVDRSYPLDEEVKRINKLSLSTSFKASMLEALSGSSYFVGIITMLLVGFYAVDNSLMNVGAIFASAMYIERVLGPTTALTSIYFSSREAFYRRSRIRNQIT